MPNDLLRTVPFFADLDEDDLSRISAATIERALPAGDRLFDEGDESHQAYVIVSGELEIEIKAPQYLEGGTAVGGPAERLALIGDGLGELDFSEVEQLIAEMQATLPKASLEVSAGVQIPAELQAATKPASTAPS